MLAACFSNDYHTSYAVHVAVGAGVGAYLGALAMSCKDGLASG